MILKQKSGKRCESQQWAMPHSGANVFFVFLPSFVVDVASLALEFSFALR